MRHARARPRRSRPARSCLGSHALRSEAEDLFLFLLAQRLAADRRWKTRPKSPLEHRDHPFASAEPAPPQDEPLLALAQRLPHGSRLALAGKRGDLTRELLSLGILDVQRHAKIVAAMVESALNGVLNPFPSR